MYKRSRKTIDKAVRNASRAAAITQQDAPFTAKQVQKFEAKLVGEVVLPTDPSYNTARMQSNMACQNYPLIIVYCETAADVKQSIKFARKHEIWVSVRSGGHSTAGYSVNTGLVIDVSRLKYVVVDEDSKTAIVGAGTNFGLLNSVINQYKLHVPGGGCPDVCVAGYMQGGGFGFTCREFGMNCDNVLEIQVMLADGSLVRANRDKNPDLFWAVRGGTGGNFGVLLEIKYQLHDLYDVWGFSLTWSLDDAPEAMALIQQDYMGPGNPKKLGFQVIVGYQGTEPVLTMRAMFNGSEKKGRKIIKPLLETKGVVFKNYDTAPYIVQNADLLEKPYDIPQVPDLGREEKESCYIAQKLSVEVWKEIIEFYKTTPNPYSIIVMEAYGGRINQIPEDDCAFIHRNVDMDLFVDTFWMTDEEHEQVIPWLNQFMVLINTYGNGHSYQNYPRATQVDYAHRYWGDQFPKLLEVKRKYDPDQFFHYQQSVKVPG